MGTGRRRISLDTVREIDLVNYLSSLGHEPVRIRGHEYWYLSPLRDEKTASFRVNRNTNRWKDWGDGEHGNIVDFAIKYHNWTIAGLLNSFSSTAIAHYGTRSSVKTIQQKPEPAIKILKEKPLYAYALLSYLRDRRVPMEIADRYCREVWYTLHGNSYYAIGFKNDLGGYELRNPYYKTSSRPKTITTYENASDELCVFEGFFDFLSFLSIHRNIKMRSLNFLVLNSLSFFEGARSYMEKHRLINLYLDRDPPGINLTLYACSFSKCYRDESGLYAGYKDLNDWMVNIGKTKT